FLRSVVGIVAIFDTFNLKNIGSIPTHQSYVQSLAFNANGTLLATASRKGTVIRIWSVASLTKIMSLRRGSTECTVYHLSFHPSSEYLVSTGSSGTIHLFKIKLSSDENYGRKFIEDNNLASSIPLLQKNSVPMRSRDITDGSQHVRDDRRNSKDDTVPVTHQSSFRFSKYETVPPSNSQPISSSNLSILYKSTIDSLKTYIPDAYREVIEASRCFAWVHLRSTSSSVPALAISRSNDEKFQVFVASSTGCAYVYECHAKFGGECRLRDEHFL
ncbi:putative Autophagy-related protein 18, partial [Cardiosporidium cionae]